DLDLAGGEILDGLVATTAATSPSRISPPARSRSRRGARAPPRALHQPGEAAEEVAGVGRAGRRPGMVRDGERRRPLHRDALARGRRRGDDPHLAAGADEVPEDVVLDAEVVGDHAERWPLPRRSRLFRRRVAAPQLPGTFRPLVRLGTRDVAHEVAPDQTRRLL